MSINSPERIQYMAHPRRPPKIKVDHCTTRHDNKKTHNNRHVHHTIPSNDRNKKAIAPAQEPTRAPLLHRLVGRRCRRRLLIVSTKRQPTLLLQRHRQGRQAGRVRLAQLRAHQERSSCAPAPHLRKAVVPGAARVVDPELGARAHVYRPTSVLLEERVHTDAF